MSVDKADTRFSRPLPARIEVNAHALAMLLNALNTSISAVRELQVTRGFGLGETANPIDTLERELMAAQASPDGQTYITAIEEAELFVSGELHNYKRQPELPTSK